MSVATVKAHVSRVLEELELNNRVQIALLAHDGVLRPDVRQAVIEECSRLRADDVVLSLSVTQTCVATVGKQAALREA
jgi:hypothetical protein